MADLPTVRSCATSEVHERLLRTVEGYADARTNIEGQAWRAAMRPGTVGRSGCTLIPVVVHVVHRTNAEDISLAQIQSQIDILNDDYRGQNADVSTVPSAFSGLVGDARIQFELASTDPDGNPTDGITRTRTNVNGFSSNDDVKRAADGGADAWPADRYLNLWVCRLAGGLLGYAQFPGGPAATDGVVVTHTGFGNTGTAAAPFDQGRTTTHEIGHWLNLRHIWGDDGTGCSGDDFVADTPNQAGFNTGVPTFPSISCSNGPNGDMFMNYMDYVDDAAMVMFSKGQVDRMQAALDGPRSSIGSSTPCVGVDDGPGEKPPWKEWIKDNPKDWIKDNPKDWIKEPIKESPKDWIKEPIKELPKDPPKEFPKEGSKDGIFDPVGPVVGPIDPIGPVKLDTPDLPFVIGTGAGAGFGGQRRSAAADALRTQMWALYNVLATHGLEGSVAQGVQQAEALYRQENG